MFQDTRTAVALGPSRGRLGSFGFALAFHGAIGITLLLAAALAIHPVKIVEPPRPIIWELVLPPSGGGSPPPAGPSAPAPAAPSFPEIPTPPALVQPTETPPTIDAAPHDGTDVGLGADTGVSGLGPGTGDGAGNGIGSGSGPGIGPGVGPGIGPGLEGGPIEVTGEMEPPRLLYRVEPDYPPVLRAARMSGRVILRAVVGLDGGVERIEIVTSPHELFSRASEDAVRQWRYRPATIQGRPVRVWFTVRVDFVLR